MRVLVCGSRDWHDVSRMVERIAELSGHTTIVTGDARGADGYARAIARGRGLALEVHRADWARHGRAAGPIRNGQMVTSGIDLVLAFWDGQSAGTRDCISQACSYGLVVEVHEPGGKITKEESMSQARAGLQKKLQEKAEYVLPYACRNPACERRGRRTNVLCDHATDQPIRRSIKGPPRLGEAEPLKLIDIPEQPRDASLDCPGCGQTLSPIPREPRIHVA